MPLPDKVLRQDANTPAPCNGQAYEWHRFQSYKKPRKPRTFSVSYQLALDSASTLFESRNVFQDKGLIPSMLTKKQFLKKGGKDADFIEKDGKGYVAFRTYLRREWVEIDLKTKEPVTGELVLGDDFLKKYSWTYTHQFNTYIGRDYKPKQIKQ